MTLTPDYFDMLRALLSAKVDFLLVGAHARAVHGTPRATGDLDIWIRRDEINAGRVYQALVAFGAPLSDLDRSDFLMPELVYQIGVAPNRIDLLTDLSGIDFGVAWEHRLTMVIQGLPIPVIGRDDFIKNKLATGRMRDLADVEDVESNGGDGNEPSSS